MKKILGIIVLIAFLPTLSFSDSTVIPDGERDEWVNSCVIQYSSQFNNDKKKTKTYCTCTLDYIAEETNKAIEQLNNLKSDKEVKKLLTKIAKKARNHCVTKVTKIKTDSKKLKDSVLTKEKIILEYKSTLPECEGGEADMGKDILRWTKWNNCLGTLKLIDESGEELTFVSEFKNGEMMGKFTFTSNNEVLFAERKKSGCKRNGYQIVDGSLAKVKLNKNCDITKITYLD